MKRYIRCSDAILCMANVRGNKVMQPHKLPFSFYFSSDDGVSHGIRVKPSFNPEKLRVSLTGTLKLTDDWEYIPGPEDTAVSSRAIQDMKQFFRDYLVLFCAVWDDQLDDGDVEDYFRGEISLQQLVQQFDFYEDYHTELDKVKTIAELESVACGELKLIDLKGNPVRTVPIQGSTNVYASTHLDPKLMAYIPRAYKPFVADIYEGRTDWNEYTRRWNTELIVEWVNGERSTFGTKAWARQSLIEGHDPEEFMATD